MNWLRQLFSEDGFMPHGHCYMWDKGLLGLHLISDGLIVASYFSIPITLLYFIRKRKDIRFSWMLVCFATFIIACGTTHLLEIWTVWHPAYWLSGAAKAVTALASVPTAILLIKLVPEALAFPSAASLQAANLELRREIEGRQQGEIALRKSQLMFQRLFDNAPDAIILIDRAGLIVRVNARAEGLFGSTKEELGSQNIATLVPERFRPELSKHLASCFAAAASSANLAFELFVWRKSGLEFPVDIMLSCVDAESDAKAIVVFRDITSRKANEQEIQALNAVLVRRAIELESVNGEMESFSYSVSHDLRAPLRHIGSFAKLLNERLGPSIDATGQRYLRIIDTSVKLMGKLIDDVLSFSSTARTPITLTTVDTDRLVAEIVPTGAIVEGGPVVEWEIGPLGTVEADASMLRQVWANLIENAVKYSSKNPHPRIIITRVTDDVANEHVFSVRDNGVGFDMAFVGKLFSAFQRLHGATEFEGTGIGLATVRRIVGRHGGRTWATGKVNEGAVIYFSLPYTRTSSLSTGGDPVVLGTRPAFLVPEDENLIQRTLAGTYDR